MHEKQQVDINDSLRCGEAITCANSNTIQFTLLTKSGLEELGSKY